MFKKVLALDCDGTLWDGIVSEDGDQGVRPYVEFQRAAKKLSRQGVLLVLVSKNDENLVWSVFDNNSNMVLDRNDIVGYRINWNEKSESLRHLAEELDIDLDSFVFWDDTIMEREKVRASTSVIVPNLPLLVEDWASHLQQEFYCDEVTQDDIDRAKHYRSRALFQKEKTSSNPHQFLESIGMTPRIIELDSEESLARAEQLCARTNQFNLTTIRHDKESIARMNGFLVGLTDKYGDHGLVGLVLTKCINEDVILDSFLLSCRVVQRELEVWMLNKCCERIQGKNKLLVRYTPTKRNGMAAQFLPRFMTLSKDGLYEGDVNDILAKTRTTNLFR